MPRKDQDRGWADDPLVDLVSPHLRAAMELRSLGPTAVAQALGRRENPQTIHHLQLGDGRKRCRQSRRRALARALRVPDTWLGGEPVEIPAPLGYRLAHEVASSPRVAITLASLAESVVTAVQRDIERAAPRPRNPTVWLEPADEVVQGVLAALGDLLSLASWQHLVLLPSTGPPLEAWPEKPGRGQPADLPAVDARRETAVLALMEVWRALLEPWCAGTAALDYRGLLALWKAQRPVVAQWLPDNWSPADADAPAASSPEGILVRQPPAGPRDATADPRASQRRADPPARGQKRRRAKKRTPRRRRT